MVEKVINHLLNNPEEAFAVLTGNASPIGLDVSQMLEVLRFFSSGSIPIMAGYWK